MQEQLGFTILEMKLVGLEGSGGSTPLKLRVVDEHGAERSVFAKLYAKNHVRADRWYKLGRMMLYGRLEDETPFKTVRRFVEYEDYTLRLLGEYGFPTPAALGIVEITPEREYLIAMEFFDGAEEIGDADIDEQVIDEGLADDPADVGRGAGPPRHQAGEPDGAGWAPTIDRRLLRAGAAVAVAAGRGPREHDAGARAPVGCADRLREGSRYFTPEELAEAFAATRGVASPTQLRNFMKRDGRDLLVQFRALAPARVAHHHPALELSSRRADPPHAARGVRRRRLQPLALLPEPRRRIDPCRAAPIGR